MSNQERTTRSSPAMVPSMCEPERFLHDANTRRLLVTIARRIPSAPAARDEAASAPQSFAKALKTLDNADRRPKQETSRITRAQGQIDMSSSFPLHQLVQRVITSEAYHGLRSRKQRFEKYILQAHRKYHPRNDTQESFRWPLPS